MRTPFLWSPGSPGTTIRSRSRSETIPAGSTAADGPSSAATVTDARFASIKHLARAPAYGLQKLVDEHPVRAGHCPQLGHDGYLKGDPFVESRLHVGGRFEWYCGFDQIELDSPRASLGQIRTERRNRRRFRRYQRLTPVVALRIHSPEVRS